MKHRPTSISLQVSHVPKQCPQRVSDINSVAIIRSGRPRSRVSLGTSSGRREIHIHGTFNKVTMFEDDGIVGHDVVGAQLSPVARLTNP
jgi:hypothetical protein